MCGIAAILGVLPADQVDASLRAMLDAQVHRGPDDEGSVVVPVGRSVLGLGNRRLAIQDISPLGHQPIRNENTGDLLVYNGEIYNAPALRQVLESQGYRFRGHSDTEVLLRAYEHWGTECLDRLRGMFAFALWDSRHERLIIARDHLGIKPLYYSCSKGLFVCASEVRALVQSGLVGGEIDRRALAGYLAYGSVQEPLTIYKNVYSLPRGCWRQIDCTGTVLSEGNYWHFPSANGSERRRVADLMEEGRALLEKGVGRHLLSDVRLGVFLSGGLDSTAILGLSHDQSPNEPFDAFTVTFPDHPQYNEKWLASATAARFGARFHDCPVSDSTAMKWIKDGLKHMDQPSMDGFNTYIVARAVREQGIVVALSGLGGDEVFGGYNLSRRVPWAYDVMSWLGQLPRGARIGAARLATMLAGSVARYKATDIALSDPGLIGLYFHYRRLVSDGGLRVLGFDAKELGLSEDFQVRNLRYEDCYLPADQINSVGRLDATFYLQNTLLRDSDVFGMANSLEIRVPFLDRDVVEWAFSLPGDVLLPRRAPLKYLLRKMCADFYSKAQIRQAKQGFTIPLAAWMVGPLREVVDESLSSLASSAILDSDGVQFLWKSFEREPQSSAWSRVWALVTLGQWLKLRSASLGLVALAWR
jgi:asparagine synthase (glutamine-hydrolysing)